MEQMSRQPLFFARLSLHVALIAITVVFTSVDLQAQPKNPWIGMTVQHPKNQMVMITPLMLAQPQHYEIQLYDTVRTSPVVLTLYHHTGIEVSEKTIELPAPTDRLSFASILEKTAFLPSGYYYYQIKQNATPRRSPQTDSLVFRDVSNTHLPVDSTLGGYAKLADVNGDSLLDLITGIADPTSFQQPRLYINDGNGHFSDQTMQRLPQVDLLVNDLAVFDVDLDGDLDLFFVAQDAQSQSFESTDRLFLNDGSGHFSDVSTTHLPSLPSISRSADWGLINDDSFPDLVVSGLVLAVVSSPNRTPLSVLINDGTGRFVDQSDQYLPETLYGVLDVALADVNGDRLNDIILANQEVVFIDAMGNLLVTFSGQNAVLVQTNEGLFVDETEHRMPPGVNPSKLMKVTDINQDNAPDLYAINLGSFLGSGVLHELYLNDGQGFFEEVATQRLPPQGLTNINDVAFRDFDGDGDVDMYVVNTVLGGPARDFLNVNEDGFFRDVSEGLPPLEGFGISTTSGDIDQDGDHDLFVSNGNGLAGLKGLDRLLENIGTTATASEPTPSLDRQHYLFQNHPNPFTVSTTISYSIPRPGFVTISVYDVRGKEIRTLTHAFHQAGTYSLDFEADRLPTGVYFYQLKGDHGVVETKKMVRVR